MSLKLLSFLLFLNADLIKMSKSVRLLRDSLAELVSVNSLPTLSKNIRKPGEVSDRPNGLLIDNISRRRHFHQNLR
jgi:hypothetical protein